MPSPRPSPGVPGEGESGQVALLGAGGGAVRALDFGVAFFGLHLAQDFGGVVDVESAAFVDGVAADHAGDDDFGVFHDDEVSGDGAEDVDAAAFFDGEVAVDGAAEIELAVVDDGDVAADGAPEGQGLVDDHRAGELAAFFPHVGFRHVHNVLTGTRGGCKGCMLAGKPLGRLSAIMVQCLS